MVAQTDEWQTQTGSFRIPEDVRQRVEAYTNAMAQEQVLEHLRARTSNPWGQPSAILGVMGLVITIGGALALGGVAWSNSNQVPELATRIETVAREQVRNEEQHKAILDRLEVSTRALDRLERRLGTKPSSPHRDDP